MPATMSYTRDALGNVVLSLTETADPFFSGSSMQWDGSHLIIGATAVDTNYALKVTGTTPILALASTSSAGGVNSGILRFIGNGGKQYQHFINSSDGYVLRDGTRGVNVLTITTTGVWSITPVTSLTLTAGDFILAVPTVPASASAAGVAGTISWASGFLYVCVATNTWQRVAIATW